MIAITPYYDRNDGKDILKRYLRMVANVVPFLPEDVLFDDEEGVRQQTRKRKKSPPKRRRSVSETIQKNFMPICMRAVPGAASTETIFALC